MEDARLEWIRDRLYNGLDLKDPKLFENFLDDDKNDDVMRKFFSQSSAEETAYAILFYIERIDREREITVDYEVEVEVTDDEEEPENEESG